MVLGTIIDYSKPVRISHIITHLLGDVRGDGDGLHRFSGQSQGVRVGRTAGWWRKREVGLTGMSHCLY